MHLPSAISAPIHPPRRPREPVVAGAIDCHAHIFGPSDRFPYAAGRAYTPPDAPVTKYLAMLDAVGFARGVCVQGNAHGFDNRAILDALAVAPDRLRAVGITDLSAGPDDLRAWHALGMRGLRFHIFHPDHRPAYVRGVGMDVFEAFRPTMLSMGWHMQVWCDWRQLGDLETTFSRLGRELPVVIDHMANVDATQGPEHPSFQALLRLLGSGHIWVKLSGAYRASEQYPDYPDARVLHQALVATNPEHLVWGSDWPHPQIEANRMPDDGHLVDLLMDWTPAALVRRILVENPERLYGFPRWEGQ
jgi:2-pyrone-4,6-dicarboxylate lactonase